MNLYFAPMEGIAGYTYRNAQIEIFGGADKYFAPFVTPSHNLKMKGKEIKDILPLNNSEEIKLVPQILANNPEYFIRGLKQIMEMGYDEINFNAGCPSGTVVSKGRGAGILKDTREMDIFFQSVFEKIEKEGIKIKLSVKTRIGVEKAEEFEEILDVYGKYPFSELIVHPRTRMQMYKGMPDMEAFGLAEKKAKTSLCYNGNIFEVSDYHHIVDSHNIDSIMIGRGILQNPNLFNEIRGEDKIAVSQIYEFQNRLYEEYKERISGEKQVLFKMKEVWNYLSYNFSDQHKCEKLIRKAQSLYQYDKAVDEIINNMSIK